VKYFSDPSSTENYWCTPEQTLKFGGDCEDHSLLLASMIISLGGAVQMYMTDSHAFIGLYIGQNEDTNEILKRIREYYGTNLNLFWLSDLLGNWLILDSIGSEYPGGLPLGSVPIKVTSGLGNGSGYETYSWSWGFTETDNLYITDIIPK
jgi:transglutaminase-like putative cysteine protease